MDDFLATNGGTSDDVSYSALTMSENQPEMAGVSSGDTYIAAANSSIHEEQHNGSAVSSVPPAHNVANIVGNSAMDRTLTTETGMFSPADRATYEDMFVASSRTERSMEEVEHNLVMRLTRGAASSGGVQAPLEDISAAGDGNSSTATLGSGSDVDNALLNDASQQIGTMDAGSTTGLPMLSQEENWSMHDPCVEDFRMRNSMGDGSSATMSGTIDPRVLMRVADDSTNMTAEATPADALAGAAQPAENMDASSSIDNNIVASPATLGGSEQQPEQMDVDNSINNSGAPHAPLGGYGPPPMQTGADNSADYPVATQATPNGLYVQPQMPMVAGNSTTNNFAAQQLSVPPATYNNFHDVQQQLNFAPNVRGQQQMGTNDSVQPFTTQANVASQAYGYNGAGQAAPPNGGIGQYVQAPVWPAGNNAASAMAYQQPGGLNGGTQPNMGQNWQAAAPQPAMYGMSQQQQLPPFNGLPTPHMGPNVPIVAPQLAAPAAHGPAANLVHAANGPAANPVPAQQQVAAKSGPYTHTAAGAPNRDSTKKGNKQGQVPYWSQAFKHHNSRCDKLMLNGCVPDCEVRAKWPQTWADWNSRRFRVQWKTAQQGRPQIQDLSGFAVHAECKEKSKARFVVLGEIQANGSVGKAKSLHRLEVSAA